MTALAQTFSVRALLAFDKFKQSMSAREACEAAERGLKSVYPDIEIEKCPMTDGGEGFCEILTERAGGTIETVKVRDAAGRPCDAAYGLVEANKIPDRAREKLGFPAKGKIAIIEMAQASGLATLPENLRNPWRTCTRGTGEVMVAAVEQGVAGILIGLGGSATSDLGVGALSALGLRIAGDDGCLPCNWAKAGGIHKDSMLELPPIRIACDVSNPLLGENGAAAVYGPQKGLPEEGIEAFDDEARRMAGRLCVLFGVSESLMEMPGAGAAGGIAFGLKAAYDADLVPGFELVETWLDLERSVKESDIVMTGEGRFDMSSLDGKGPASLIRMAAWRNKRIFILAGSVDDKVSDELSYVDDLYVVPVSPPDLDLERSLKEGCSRLEAVVAEIAHGMMHHDAYRQKRHSRIRMLKKIMRPLPRKAMIHKYPILRHFSETARSRSYLWSFRQQHVIRAIYVGCVLSLLPIYGLQIVSAFFLSLYLRANLMVMAALQFITNPITAVPLYILCFQIGNFVLSPFMDVGADVNFPEIAEHTDEPGMSVVAEVLEQSEEEDAQMTARKVLHVALSMVIGGVLLGLLIAVIISFVYQWIAKEAAVSYKWLQYKRHGYRNK